MATPAENKKASSNNKILIVVGIIVIALLAVIVALLLRQSRLNIDDEDVPKIGYAANATVVLDQDALQAAADRAQANARDGRIALRYQNNAYSTDGETFSCMIANSQDNLYDMFLTIYADEDLTDQIYLSGLVPPGSGFEEITLEHPLEKGDHTVYVALTQVDTDEDGEQVMKHQVMHTMEFHVT